MKTAPVIRVYSTSQDPDYDSPWQSQSPTSGTGSGVVIDDGLVLTGAHVVANATFIQVQKLSDPDKVVARVKAICHDADLALLEIEDPQFTKDIGLPVIGELCDLQDEVSVVGFPIGGDEISITEGVVSRVEVQQYDHSQRHLLAATVDAAINEGNSGGPVFKDGKIVGIAFQKLSDADNIGEMVPAPLIHRFLEAVKTGRSVEMPSLGIVSQNLENRVLRKQVGLSKKDTGVLVSAVEWGSATSGVLKPGDALLKVAGYSIANNGTIRFQDRYRTLFDAALTTHFIGDRVRITYLRDGERHKTEITLGPMRPLVPRSQYDRAPTYYLFGGLVFQKLTRDFLATWDEWWDKAPNELLSAYYTGIRNEEQHEMVVLSRVFADELTVGYEHYDTQLLKSVNGQTPRDMRHLVQLVENARGVISFETARRARIDIDSDEARAALTRIMRRYRIPRDRSDDLVGAGHQTVAA
jgi:S1-C subfamily serine protease